LNFNKVNFTFRSDVASSIEEILIAHEAISISFFDNENKPIYEPKVGETPLWEHVEISALFEKNVSKEFITTILEGIEFSDLNIKKLSNQNWIKKYQENFKPIKFGKKLWVVPSWSQGLSNPGSVELKMDPGMAFGSGSHETTRLCLEYLDENPPRNLSIMDYGCGSGILGIASILLGATKVLAIDIDPQALIATKENSINNSVAEKIEILDHYDSFNTEVDLVIANIFFNTLINYRDQFFKILKPGGKIVLSGILKDQVNSVIHSYLVKFNISKVQQMNGWHLIEFIKN